MGKAATGLESRIVTAHEVSNNIAQKYPDELKGKRIFFYRLARGHASFILENGRLPNPKAVREMIAEYNTIIDELEKECLQKAKDEYWAKHASEKKALEDEKKKLEMSLKEYEMEMNSIPGMSDKLYFESVVASLSEQKKSLGVFKGKEKKEIQKQIDYYQKKTNDLITSMKPMTDVIMNKTDIAKKRIEEIELEFCKERL